MAIDTVTSRRRFLKLTGIGAAGMAAAELGGLGFDLAFAGQRAARRKLEGTKQTASICPYCAVGCGTLVNAKTENGRTTIVNIEGNPDSPINTGSLCPKGAATFQLVTGSHRVKEVLYRRPYGTEWEAVPLERAMEMVAQRVKRARDETWKDTDEDGNPLNHTLGIAHLGGATLDNEENYLIKKLFTALGVIQVENQARI